MPHTILSSRGREKLVDDLNFIYTAQKKNADGTKQYWRCEVTACKARVHTTVGDETFTIVKSVNEHNHSTTAAAVKAREAMVELKAVATSTQESSRALVANVLSKLDEHSLAHVPSTSTMSRYVRQWRQDAQQAPPIPQTRTGYVVPEEYTKLESGEMFLQHDSGIEDENRILVFASAQGLRDLVRYKSWGFDGTFKCCPKIFAQLFTIHSQDGTFSVPRVFALLPSKTEETYTRVFSILKDLQPELSPQDVMMDFEMASYNAFIASFGYASVTFCLFHLSQNIYRKVVDCNERQRYHREDEYALKIRCFTALAFLPIQDVVAGFEELVDDDDLPQELIDYFAVNYIGSERGRGQNRRRMVPRFKIADWNVRDRALQDKPRTNNNLEGFHNALQSSVTQTHPNIWCLIKGLKKEEVLANGKRIKFEHSGSVCKPTTATKNIKNLIEKYDPNEKMLFLRAVAHNLKLF